MQQLYGNLLSRIKNSYTNKNKKISEREKIDGENYITRFLESMRKVTYAKVSLHSKQQKYTIVKAVKKVFEEIINEEEVKKKEKIEKYKIAEKIAKSSDLKDVHSVQSVQKLLLRENVDDQAPLKITIIKENPLASCVGYIPNQLPFLRYLPLV